MERAIASGVWTVGEKIPPEPELMAHFGVSRNTLREAIQALIHGGVLQARQGDGTYIDVYKRQHLVCCACQKS